MVAKRSNRRSKVSYSAETTPRHVWLAGLGLVAMARRELPLVANRALSDAMTVRDRGLQLACDARDIARGAAMTLGEAIEAGIRNRTNKPARRKARKTGATAKRTTRRPAGKRKTTRKTGARKQG